MKDHDSAVQACDKAVQRATNPELKVQAMYTKTLALYKLKRQEEATLSSAKTVETIDEVLPTQQNKVDLLIYKARLLAQVKKCDEAVQTAEMALMIDPKSKVAMDLRGELIIRVVHAPHVLD